MKAFIFLAICFLAAPAFAQDQQFRNGEAVPLRPDQAYLLARTFEMKGRGLSGTQRVALILIRVLGDDELKQADNLRLSDPKHWQDTVPSNVSVMAPQEPYAQSGNEVTLLTSVKPGIYILAAVAAKGRAGPSESIGMKTASFCMGTVRFEAKAGTVTDLGEILTAYDSEPTTIPELEKVVSGKSGAANQNFGPPVYAVAIRPVSNDLVPPPPISSLPRVPAEYRAEPAYPNYLGGPLSRLAPMPGVLDYNADGDVVDLKQK